METLYDPEVRRKVMERLHKITPYTQRQWRIMDAAQMLAHCAAILEVATGQKNPPRLFIGRLLDSFFKSAFTNDKPFKKNTPTDKSFIVADQRDFEREREHLENMIKQFGEGGEATCTTHPHNFFGKLTPEAWGIGMYKHLDHHLRQFNA